MKELENTLLENRSTQHLAAASIFSAAAPIYRGGSGGIIKSIVNKIIPVPNTVAQQSRHACDSDKTLGLISIILLCQSAISINFPTTFEA
ncbi:MAG: hypothetical protein M3O71_14745 [Bacteroidota bacterium]|nr:hypothetical protein [Bacteroidota bacterium]